MIQKTKKSSLSKRASVTAKRGSRTTVKPPMGSIPMSSAGWRKFAAMLKQKPKPNAALTKAARLLDERIG
jgi:hypothetical protein